MTNIDKLRPAAEEGNISKLYEIIKDNPSILQEDSDHQFLQTPLHIAAAKGHLPFASELMNLKHSFSFKLNPQGWSPIHLAIQNQEKRMVLYFVNMNKELVRVKAREGITPLHLASEIGDVELLAEFLTACPESINDVTVRGESALHIAAKNKKYEALHLLVCFLKKNTEMGAKMLEYKILNQKDEDDNTVLHISAVNNDPKELQLLIKSMIDLNAKNLANKTALDMTISEEIYNLLSRAGAKSGSQVTDPQTLASKLKSMTTILDKVLIHIFRIKSNISDEQRNILLIIMTLIVTATYQSVLSPPGGVYQASASDNNVNNITSSNSTISDYSQGNVGRSVMLEEDFFLFSYFNMVSFFISMITILILTPRGTVVFTTFLTPMFCLAMSYLHSMWMISPTSFNDIVVAIFYFSMMFVAFIFFIITEYSRVQRRNAKKFE